jgi:superfamily II DNA or RNA helicase
VTVGDDDTRLADARDAIARAVLGADPLVGAELGSITLRADQRRAAARLLAMLDASGGAMLAEPVGLGKTYVALAVARDTADVVIATPASLRAMWSDALASTGVRARLVAHESLSRPHRQHAPAQLVIVDEAHRFRARSTRRYAALAELSANARVLLLTATPIHNRRDDLATQLALFLGRAVWSLRDDQLAAHVLREAGPDDVALPRLEGPVRVELSARYDFLDELVDLPPPIPAADEGVAAALLTYSLVHQWTSSHAAVIASLRRRLARITAMRDALAAGRHVTRRDLSAWSFADDAVQLAFPELVAPTCAPASLDAAALLASLELADVAARSVIDVLRIDDADVERAARLRALRLRHPGERMIAFCQYAETANTLYRALARDGGVAVLTSRGARVAGGRLSRASVLAQYTPHGDVRDATPLGSATRIDLLLATDLLSEGLNLQSASVVVHLDLPWNPARLEQRVGRVRRVGARRSVVTVYAFAPPASAERLLRIEQRLRDKLRIAQHTVGVSGQILPSPVVALPAAPRVGAAEAMGATRGALREWIRESAAPAHTDTLVAAVCAHTVGVLAAVRAAGEMQLVADVGRGLDASAATVAAAIMLASGRAAAADPRKASEQVARLVVWLRERRGASAVNLRAAAAGRSRREALTRVARALARAPHHRRAALASLAAAARSAITSSLGEGAERVLDVLAAAPLPDEAWLRSLATFGALNARQSDANDAGPSADGVVALILFTTPPPCDDTSDG